MERVTLKVEGMSCSHCKAAVEKSLKETPGVREAVVDLGSGMVTVQYDSSKVTRDGLIKAVVDAGYEVPE